MNFNIKIRSLKSGDGVKALFSMSMMRDTHTHKDQLSITIEIRINKQDLHNMYE